MVISWGTIGWVVLGGIAGWIASKIMGRDAQMGIGANILVASSVDCSAVCCWACSASTSLVVG